MSKNSKKPFFIRKKLLILLACVFGLLILSAIPLYGFYVEYWYGITEKDIDKAFHQDIKQYPQVKLKTFKLWEGDSIVTIDVPKKGEVMFWYGQDRVPRITQIGSYSANFTCYHVNREMKKTGYAYDMDLRLDSNSKEFSKWFHFRVNTLGDLIYRYDAIINVLASLPKNPPQIDFHDNWGERRIRKTPDPMFQISPQQGVSCDVFTVAP